MKKYKNLKRMGIKQCSCNSIPINIGKNHYYKYSLNRVYSMYKTIIYRMIVHARYDILKEKYSFNIHDHIRKYNISSISGKIFNIKDMTDTIYFK